MKKRALLFVLFIGIVFLPAVTLGKHQKASAKKKQSNVQSANEDSNGGSSATAQKSAALAPSSPQISLASVEANQITRAIWVGEEAKQITTDSTAQNQFFSFAKSPFGNVGARVNRIILNTEVLDFTSASQMKGLRAFLKRAHQENMQVEFLTGKEYWVKDSSGMNSAMKRMDRMIAFNNGSSDAQERFDGMHYDIRPYLNSGWKKNTSGGLDEYNNKYEKNYLAILTAARKKITESGQNITLAVDLPTWFSHSVSDIWKPLTAAGTPVNYISLFNNFDTADTFLHGYGGSNKSGGIGPNLAKTNSVPLIFAASVTKEESNSLTFKDEDVAKMESVFAKAVSAYGNNPQFKGLGVFNYGAYKAMNAGTVTPVVVPEPASAEPVADKPVPAPAPVVTPSLKNVRAMWVWSESDEIVVDSAAQSDFFTFIKAPHGDASARINRLYLSGDSFDYKSTSEKNALHSFIKKAHGQGIAVEFLAGNPKWAIPGQEGNALTRCDRMIAFNAETNDPKERFDGMHFDIEPYVLSEWKTNSGAGSDSYNDDMQKTYAKVLAVCKQKMKDSGQNIILSVDIPTWFSKATDTWNYITADNSPVDYITFMNYFDTEATFLYGYNGVNKTGGIGPNLKQGGKIPMVFGAETISFEGTTISFYEEGFGALEKVFDRAEEVFGDDPEFAGTAVHHYRTFKLMKK